LWAWADNPFLGTISAQADGFAEMQANRPTSCEVGRARL